MAGRQKYTKNDPRQQSFVHLLEQTVGDRITPPEPIPEPRKGDERHKMRLRLNKALAACSLSREEVADAVSAITNEKITKMMIDNWTAQTHPHEFPGYLYSSFCRVLGNTILLDDTAQEAGCKVVDSHIAQAAYYLMLTRYADTQIKHYIGKTPLFEGGSYE